MFKKYISVVFLVVVLFSLNTNAQATKIQSKTNDRPSIEGLNVYPNPVSNGKLYITSKKDSDKGIVIFDLLGKTVLQTLLNTNELNVSDINPGVYLLKVSENNISSTRKLIIR